VVSGGSSAIRGLSVCARDARSIKPGSSFGICADTEGMDVESVTVEIEGAFQTRLSSYGNCANQILVPGSAVPGTARVIVTVWGRDGRKATSSTSVRVTADTQVPTIEAVVPNDGHVLDAGEHFQVGVDAWDDVAISSVILKVGDSRIVL